jgi:DedD protein
MDSRAKQRLTGAVILVALFVLLVPELLRGPRGAANAPADTPADEGMRRYTIDLNSSGPAAQPANTTPPPAVELPAVAQNLAVPGEAAAPELQAEPSQAAPAPATAAAPAAVTAPASEAAAPAAVVTPPAPRVEPPRQATATPAGHGSFVVQLGSFGSKENADRLVRDMTAKGFAAFVAPITSGGRELYRVRVGPTRDRPAAEALAAQLRRIGQSGSIVPIS